MNWTRSIRYTMLWAHHQLLFCKNSRNSKQVTLSTFLLPIHPLHFPYKCIYMYMCVCVANLGTWNSTFLLVMAVVWPHSSSTAARELWTSSRCSAPMTLTHASQPSRRSNTITSKTSGKKTQQWSKNLGGPSVTYSVQSPSSLSECIASILPWPVHGQDDMHSCPLLAVAYGNIVHYRLWRMGIGNIVHYWLNIVHYRL